MRNKSLIFQYVNYVAINSYMNESMQLKSYKTL